MHAEGHESSNSAPVVELYMATPGYFETMGIPRIAGRDFANEAPNGPKVAIINQAFVERVFGRENPIGQHVIDGDTNYEVIGVVKNIKSRTLGEETRPVLFRSLAQSTGSDPAFLGYTLLGADGGRLWSYGARGDVRKFMRSTRRWRSSTKRRWRNIFAMRSSCLDWRERCSACSDLWGCCSPRLDCSA